MNLFASKKTNVSIQLPLKDADVIYIPNFFSSEIASEYFKTLEKIIAWQQDEITLFGKTHPQPRLTALYGSTEKTYSYSGITMHPKPFSSEIKKIKEKIEEATLVKFNTVLLNLYRDGNDSNGWHSDDEKELGHNPLIASVSFGTSRVFHFRHKQDKSLRFKLTLEHGSLLIMKGATQHYWQHQLPKSKRVNEPRINLTFRIIK